MIQRKGGEWPWKVISAKVWDRAGIELVTPGSAVRLASVARHVTDCPTRPGNCFVWFDKCVMLKDHNAVTPVRFNPAAPQSWVKRSTTEPLRAHKQIVPRSRLTKCLSWSGSKPLMCVYWKCNLAPAEVVFCFLPEPDISERPEYGKISTVQCYTCINVWGFNSMQLNIW